MSAPEERRINPEAGERTGTGERKEAGEKTGTGERTEIGERKEVRGRTEIGERTEAGAPGIRAGIPGMAEHENEPAVSERTAPRHSAAPETAAPLIECRGLTKVFSARPALEQLDLTIEGGGIIGLLGPNGSGKTTLIKILNGLIRPTAGEVRIGGHKPGEYTRSIISYLPDKSYFDEWMRCRDLMDLFEDFYPDFNRSGAENLCAVLGIDGGIRLREMSKGTKEKIQLILVMSRRARLYLLDEPIAGVDPAARDFILDTILSNSHEDGTILISTHLITDIEQVLDEVIFLSEGRVIRHERAGDMRRRTGMTVDEVFREDFRALPHPTVLQASGTSAGGWTYPAQEKGDRSNDR